jgi:hypothetical protein
MVVMVMPQLDDRAVPGGMGALGGCQCLGIGLRHNYLAEDSHFGRRHMAVEPAGPLLVRRPGLPVGLDELPHVRGWTEPDEMVAVPGRIYDALRVMRGVPQWRVGCCMGWNSARTWAS